MKKYFLLWTVFSFIFVQFIFKHVNQNQFLYQQDEYLPISNSEINNSLLALDPADLGTRNSTITLVTYFDRIFYVWSNKLGLTLYQSQISLYTIKFVLLTTLPLASFYLWSCRLKRQFSTWQIFCVSTFYSFNTFTLIYWHGNGFSLTLLICYSLLPLCFYLFSLALATRLKFKYVILLTFCLWLMSYALYFFAVVLLFYLGYFLLMLLKNPKLVISNLYNFLLISMILIPLLGHHYLSVRELFLNPLEAVNTIGGETHGNIQGGFLYQLLMWHTWAIYVEWFPRNLYTFANYFRSPHSLVAPIYLYSLVIIGLKNNYKKYFASILFFLLLIFLLLAQGNQEPFGLVYNWLITNISPFRVFRSPDNKFSFVIMFIVSLLLLYTLKKSNKYIFLSIFLVSLIQSIPLLSGEALLGVNSKYTSDKVLGLSSQHKEVLDYINANPSPFGYVLPFPLEPFSHYITDVNGLYIGQDLLLKYSYLPFLTPNEYSGISARNFFLVKKSIESNNFESLNSIPIRYFLFRNDTKPSTVGSLEEKWISMNNTSKVVDNSKYVLYKNNSPTPIFNLSGIKYYRFNTSKYYLDVEYTNASVKDIDFRLNQDPEWQLKVATGIELNCINVYNFSNNIQECSGLNAASSNSSLLIFSYRPQELFHTFLNLNFLVLSSYASLTVYLLLKNT